MHTLQVVVAAQKFCNFRKHSRNFNIATTISSSSLASAALLLSIEGGGGLQQAVVEVVVFAGQTEYSKLFAGTEFLSRLTFFVNLLSSNALIISFQYWGDRKLSWYGSRARKKLMNRWTGVKGESTRKKLKKNDV